MTIMMYDSWHKECVRQNFLSFWTIFCPFTPVTTQKIKILKKWNKSWRYYFTHVYHNWQSCDEWFLRYGARRKKVFVIFDCFLRFYPPKKPENQNFEKMKKSPGDIIILHMCTINDNHMMYGFWDMESDRQNFLSFWTIFFPFTTITNQKIEILQKWKKHLEILSFYTCAP